MNIYAISGLGADYRVFERLNLKESLIHLPWIPILPDDNLESYALRMAEKIDFTSPFILIGVSFGGIIAQIISQSHRPAGLILISTLIQPEEKSFWLKLAKFVPSPFFKSLSLFQSQANWFFGLKKSSSRELFKKILADTDYDFVKTTVPWIVRWPGLPQLPDVRTLRIHGTRDQLFIPRSKEVIYIEGGHVTIMDEPEAMSECINGFLD